LTGLCREIGNADIVWLVSVVAIPVWRMLGRHPGRRDGATESPRHRASPVSYEEVVG